ncbi:hypothetical protein [Lutibacter citreus]|uniref:hypothetical protein n=1 Tax=Lutibacter citreus TaxID=2138210 RepID=UPI000DBE3C9E|nr:hypothetical protein [Lutibacter citreus]
MKKYILIFFFIFNSLIVFSQLDEYSVMGIPLGSTTEINSVTPLEEGALVYNTDTKKMMVYNGTNWVSNEGGQSVYTGSFTVSNNSSISVSGLGFKPSQITFVAHANVEVFGTDGNNGSGNNNAGFNNSFGTMNGFINGTKQGVIFVGGNGNSINDISRYSSSSYCIGLRYGDQDGNKLGVIRGKLGVLTNDGFTIIPDYEKGSANWGQFQKEKVLVFYTAYK